MTKFVATQFLVFTIGDKKYAAPVMHLLEVVPLCMLSKIQGGSAEVMGYFNHRDEMIEVYNAAAQLGIEDAHPKYYLITHSSTAIPIDSFIGIERLEDVVLLEEGVLLAQSGDIGIVDLAELCSEKASV